MSGKAKGVLIVNADDLGLDEANTDAILECFRAEAISSATAMVWMEDSDRAAEIALRDGLPVGLHLNLIEPFSAAEVPEPVAATQRRVADRLRTGGVGAQLYHRAWAADFERAIADQLSRFRELYGREPTHVDGHQHSHLAFNALLSRALGSVRRCRRPANRTPYESPGHKRAARAALSRLVRLRFVTTDWCFSAHALDPGLGGAGLDDVLERSSLGSIELFVHPGYPRELARLRSADWRERLGGRKLGTYEDLG
jgi:predicted glycoside hydrolase/deacetylase ChbG (UPF0249 family)